MFAVFLASVYTTLDRLFAVFFLYNIFGFSKVSRG